VCVVERADVMLMQNWQHVVTGGLLGWRVSGGGRTYSILQGRGGDA
jgi:hypothetical protein